ncbi:hypothetical protein DHL47_07295 [Streptococcus panodentis]|uniref:Phage protein n=1 Tax=Streptococcus panodentis TaxID=1581472 RepID=A0ABS5AX24_9STRE|nr:hypothetical protein [Streptococcus panodentis]
MLEGLHYRQIDERENLSALALEMRYTLNSKKVDNNKLSKRKDREKVRRFFHKKTKQEIKNASDFVAKLQQASEMFANR